MQDSLRKKFQPLCPNGHNVTNKYTGEVVYVPCGVCPACLLKKSASRTLKLNSVDSQTEYCYMITLTYDTPYVPKMRIISNGNYHVFKSLPRLDKDGNPIKGLSQEMFEFGTFDDYEDILKFKERANLKHRGRILSSSGLFGYLDYRDFQLFNKRFRKHLKLRKHEKIHTFIVGEYGTKYYRPHWHYLLFFNSKRLTEDIGPALYKSWTFGRVDFSSSRGDVNNYVAGYVNSFVCLPSFFYRNSQIKPCCRFSNRFGQSVFKKLFGDPTEENFSQILDGVTLFAHGKPYKYYPGRSCLDSAFFPYARNTRTSVVQLLEIVTSATRTYNTISRIYETSSCLETAKALTEYLNSGFYGRENFDPNFEYHLRKTLDYSNNSTVNFGGYIVGNDKACFKKYSLRFYRLFLAIKNFLQFHHISMREVDRRISEVKKLLQVSHDFYNFRALKNLKDAYEDFQNDSCDKFEIDFFISPSEENAKGYKETSTSLLLTESLRWRCKDRVKHREFNEIYQFENE